MMRMSSLSDIGIYNLSRKCRALSFLAAVAVVAIHSDCTFVMDSPAPWNLFIQKLFCQRLTKWAVPFFFLLSGMWFGRSAYVKGQAGWWEFYIKKVKSLFIPWMLFAVIGVVVITPLLAINNHVSHHPLFERSVFGFSGIWPILDHTFGITIPEPNSAGFLWFLRTLFVLFLFAPLWRLLVKISPWIFLVGFICLKFFPNCDIPCLYFGASYPFFLGIFLGAYQDSVLMRLKAPRHVSYLILLIGVALAVMLAGIDARYWSAFPLAGLYNHCAPLLLGAGIWFVYDEAEAHIPRKLPEWTQWSMWLYLTHNFIAAWFLASMRFVLGKSDCMMVWLPFVNVVVATTLSLLIGKLLRRMSPRTFEVLCGGRG